MAAGCSDEQCDRHCPAHSQPSPPVELSDTTPRAQKVTGPQGTGVWGAGLSLRTPVFFFWLRTVPEDHQPPTANRRQPPPIVQYGFCGLVSCPCLAHEAESVPVNVRFCWCYEPSPPPPPGRPTPGVVQQDKSSGGSVDTTKTRSGPQRVRMSSGERPIGAAKGKQPDTEALCQPPPPLPCERAVRWHDGQKAMTAAGQARPEPNADTATRPLEAARLEDSPAGGQRLPSPHLP